MSNLEHDEAGALLCLVLSVTGSVTVNRSEIEKFDGSAVNIFIQDNGDGTYTIGLENE